MAEYSVVLARSARKELEALDYTIVKRIFPKLEELAPEPHPRGCIKLRGENNLWRIRVGDYRIIYSIYEERNLVDITAIRHRSNAYE